MQSAPELPEHNDEFSVCWASDKAEGKENAKPELLASSRKSGSISDQMSRIEVNWLKKYIKHEIGLTSGKSTCVILWRAGDVVVGGCEKVLLVLPCVLFICCGEEWTQDVEQKTP